MATQNESQGKHRSYLIGNHFMSKINTLQANSTGKFLDVLFVPQATENDVLVDRQQYIMGLAWPGQVAGVVSKDIHE